MTHYNTVTEAIDKLRSKGFLMDFNIAENCIMCNLDKYHPDAFEIVEIYRYEGSTDPADEAIVYGVESRDGKKGILVSGYGPTEDPMVSEIIRRMKIRKES